MPLIDHNEKKKIWAITRSVLEVDNYKHRRNGKKSRSNWTRFEFLVRQSVPILKMLHLYQRGNRNAKEVVLNRVVLDFPDLPEGFEGYKILHLTDLHLDCVKGIEDRICDRLKDCQYDLCVFTGDYREQTHGHFKQILGPMKKIVTSLAAGDGIFAILGNHDTYLMASHFESMGLKVLANETVHITRGIDRFAITGLDDTYAYYTDQAMHALEEDINGFKIVLVHSPELYDVAAENGYRLYLCGHTHGGQICLPGGMPIITHSYEGRQFYRGLWEYSDMKGYTSQGCGASGIPVRFNTNSEVTLFTFRRQKE